MSAEAHVIYELAERYPQLSLPVQAGISKSQQYRESVLKGMPTRCMPEFSFSAFDTFSVVPTPAGNAEVLQLAERDDFVHALRALAHRCEPVEILDSVGASTIKGLINWEKIHRHREAYLAAGGADWSAEFKRFTSVKTNYLDTIILLSSGNYSNVSADTAGLSEAAWKEKSLTIRKYHELTHFVCRSLYPDDIVPIRDEVLADLIGLVKAFGDYDPHLARTFLGIEAETYRPGGRLEHYAGDSLKAAIAEANAAIDRYADMIKGRQKEDVFALLLEMFPDKAGD